MNLRKCLIHATSLIALAYTTLSEAIIHHPQLSPPNTLSRSPIDLALLNTTTTNEVIPGGSPFFYLQDPTNNRFRLSSLAMSPTPCIINQPCSLSAKGSFLDFLPTITISLSVDIRLSYGYWYRVVTIEDQDMCEWATVKQGVRTKCPPRRGMAVLDMGFRLGHGDLGSGTYFIDVKLTSGEMLLTHIGAQILWEDPFLEPSIPPGVAAASS